MPCGEIPKGRRLVLAAWIDIGDPSLAAMTSSRAPPSPEISAKTSPARRPSDTPITSAKEMRLVSLPAPSSQTVPSVRTPSTSTATALIDALRARPAAASA